ncbi:MAG: GNAT family N-acetyltransferase, partial [Tabrizicola sp.]
MTSCTAFDGFLPFQQSEPYAVGAAAGGARVRWCEVDGGKALVIERGRLRLVSRGPVWSAPCGPDTQRRALRQLARWPGLTIATPGALVPGFGLLPLVTPLHHAVWDLAPNLRAGLVGKWRNRLVAAERAGVMPKPGSRATLDRLILLETEQRHARGYRSLPPGFTRALPPYALRIWEWRQAGDMAAAMVFVRHGDSATYHLGWASDPGRDAGAHAVLLVAAAEALQAEGVRWLDLGSVDTDRAPGLARFKLGT